MSAQLYTGDAYRQLAPDWHVEESPWKSEHVARVLARNGVRPHTVADVGCGAGEVLRQLQGRLPADCELCGYDIAPAAIELASSRQGPRLRFVLADFTSEDAEADLVLALDVFEHVENPFAFLRALRSRATFGVFHIPLDLSVQTVARPGALLRVRRAYGHLHAYTRDTALATLRETGWEVVDAVYTARSIEQETHVRSVRLMRVPRRVAFAVHPDTAVRLLGGYSLLVLAR